MASLRLNPEEHPVPTDDVRGLVLGGVNALWRYSGFSRRRKVLLSLWFVCAGLMPLRAAKLVISWGLSAGTRPRALSWANRRAVPSLSASRKTV